MNRAIGKGSEQYVSVTFLPSPSSPHPGQAVTIIFCGPRSLQSVDCRSRKKTQMLLSRLTSLVPRPMPTSHSSKLNVLRVGSPLILPNKRLKSTSTQAKRVLENVHSSFFNPLRPFLMLIGIMSTNYDNETVLFLSPLFYSHFLRVLVFVDFPSLTHFSSFSRSAPLSLLPTPPFG